MIDRAANGGPCDPRALIPHAQRMCLLDTVDAWDQTSIRCSARSHRDPENPLRGAHGLAALHLCEYSAQAMAAHGGLLARSRKGNESDKAPPGLLAALRSVEFAVDRVDDIEGPLTVVARQKLAGASGCVYEFEVSASSGWLARGRVSVIYPDETP